MYLLIDFASYAHVPWLIQLMLISASFEQLCVSPCVSGLASLRMSLPETMSSYLVSETQQQQQQQLWRSFSASLPLPSGEFLFTRQEPEKHFIFPRGQTGDGARCNVFTYDATKPLKATLLPLAERLLSLATRARLRSRINIVCMRPPK